MEATIPSEIYPNAPIEFVACEVQFPVSPELATDDALRALHAAFFDWLPVAQPEVETTLVFGPAAGQQQPLTTAKILRFVSRDRRLCVVVSSSRLSVETTLYPGWDAFRPTVERALSALAGIDARIPGLTRVGLRYIDEIRVPDREPVEGGWTRYLDARLSGAADITLGGRPAADMQAALQFDLGGGQAAVVRYGARRGQAVGNTPLLRRGSHGPDDPYFLFDIDSFWQPPSNLPEFSVEAALATADLLHEPVRTLFEASITDDLREIMRREPSDG
jgi:uncharacterized protein (TIGR04255 family)